MYQNILSRIIIPVLEKIPLFETGCALHYYPEDEVPDISLSARVDLAFTRLDKTCILSTAIFLLSLGRATGFLI